MGVIVDSSVFIEVERREQPLDALIATLSDDDSGMAAITASELLAGVYRADSVERRSRRETFVESVFRSIPVFPFDLQVARTHAEILAQMASTGQVIGNFDMMIAATALTHEYELLTENVREFNRVPGLDVHQPDW